MTDADLVRQHELARNIKAERVRVAIGACQADALREQIRALREAAKGQIATALDGLSKAIDRAVGPPALSPADECFGSGDAEPTSLRQLASSLSELQSAVESADAAPNADALTAFAARVKLADQGLMTLVLETKI